MARPKIIAEVDLLDRLLDAFADLGYEGTSLRELCRHLGISHNLIHRRYSSKEAAWEAAVDHGFVQLSSALAASGLRPEQEPLDQLRRVMRSYARITLERPALARIIQQESSHPGPRFDYMVERYIAPTRALSSALLAQLQDSGVMRAGAIGTVYFFLTTWGIGGLASVPEDLRGSKSNSQAALKLAYLTVDVIIDGLRKPRD
ncbi:TetR/AcrR family transcriptional regulator [Mycolicibacterium sp. 624]|uniref:TetR/AcrR family transcriptional regulator n=1 Tax=Mycolicibacterium sp. 624 TaxID=3156314 RepID=UPI0033963753